MKEIVMGPFVSYAQNCEDVVLWRALKDVRDGFYVDCGAYHPTHDSVTRAFYERGWRGVNVEPLPELLREFAEQRPEDLNLAVALSDISSDAADFYEITGSGLSTLDATIASQHVEAGFVARKINIRTTTLSYVLDELAPEVIHFLKIDVEGAERLVLSGIDFGRFRPWIVLVEATTPRGQESTAWSWENILLSGGYDFAYFDGLNRFYVARERRERATLLAIPPNVFDDFISAKQLEAVGRLRASYERSLSWRITAPLRAAKATASALHNAVERFVAAIARNIETASSAPPASTRMEDLSDPHRSAIRSS